MPLIDSHRLTQYQPRTNMKTSLLAISLLTFAAGAAFADKVRDWRDLDKVHTHIVESIHEMER